MNSSKKLKQILIFSIVLLLLPALAVIIIDPFYHYHKPIRPLKAVLNEKEYQCIGTLRNFTYSAVIAGSSVAENFNNRQFDEEFGCTSVKAIRSYGATADLCYMLDEAFASGNKIDYVFYNLDPSAFMSEPETTFKQTGCPMYMYDHNLFNDVKYLWNKDVLFKKIPYMVAKSFEEGFDEGLSYNWAQWKEFNLAMCTGMYLRHPNAEPLKDYEDKAEIAEANIDLIEKELTDHPETTFIVYMPPYSMLWWDNAYREGDTKIYLHDTKLCMQRLLKHDNVRFYYFMDDEDIILNIENNYMDTLHFSPDINEYICTCLADLNDSHRVLSEDIDARVDNMERLSKKITDELMDPYIPLIKEQPE